MASTNNNSMAPTVQNNVNSATPTAVQKNTNKNVNSAKPAVQNNSVTPLAKPVRLNSPAVIKRPTPRPGEIKTDLLCKVKYENTLPDIPFDLKFISYPNNIKRFIQYKPTSLEQSYKFDIIPEHDLGLNIDLVDKDKYSFDCNGQLDVRDEQLLEENNLVLHDSKRSQHHAKSVSWLRRTEYISTELTRFQPQTIEKVEAKVGFNIKKNFKEETLNVDRDSQMKAIEKTFEDNKKPIEKHYSKPNVHAVETLNIFPDFKNWKYPCAQVIFDSDPAPVGRPVPAQIEEMSQAMIRGVMDESGEQFVAYFLPSEETIAKRREDAVESRSYDEDYEYEYKMAREYNWNVKSKNSKGYEENYFLIAKPDGIFYNELETRVRLSKRRQKIGVQSSTFNTKLVVRHIPVSEQECIVHKVREKQLQSYNEEEEEAKAEEAAMKETIGESKKDAAGSDSDFLDVDDKQENTVNSKHANSKPKARNSSDSNDNDTEINKKIQQSANEANSNTSIKKSSTHDSNRRTQSKDSSGSEDKSDGDKLDEEESSSSGSDEESKDKRGKQGALILESDNSDVEMRSKNNSECADRVVNSKSLIPDYSDSESE